MYCNPKLTRMCCIVTAVGLVLSAAVAAESVTLSPAGLIEGGRFGEVVAALDDVNSSGTPDVLVGTPQEDAAGFDVAGAAYVFDGGTGALLYKLISPNPGTRELFGQAVTGMADVTGDGVGDLAVGGLQEAAGEVFLFDGVSGAHLLTLRSPNASTPGKFGGSIAGLNDVSGDSVPDVLVGTWFESNGALVFAGRAYVFDGVSGALLYEVLSPTPSVSGTFGYQVDAVPDVDGDGITDIVVSASSETAGVPAGGKVYVYSGAAGQFLHTLSSPNEDEDQVFGPAVSGINDINGDGAVMSSSGCGPNTTATFSIRVACTSSVARRTRRFSPSLRPWRSWTVASAGLWTAQATSTVMASPILSSRRPTKTKPTSTVSDGPTSSRPMEAAGLAKVKAANLPRRVAQREWVATPYRPGG